MIDPSVMQLTELAQTWELFPGLAELLLRVRGSLSCGLVRLSSDVAYE